MAVQFKRAERKRARAKILLSGTAGTGKTHGALLFAAGLLGVEKADSRREDGAAHIALIDTESGSASLEAGKPGIPEFDVLEPQDFRPATYVAALNAATDAGYEVVILDSLTAAWTALLEAKDKMQGGNSFTAWAKLTPVWRRLTDAIVTAQVHVIGTARRKADYAIEQDSRGKAKVHKLSTKIDLKADSDFEFGLAFALAQDHSCIAEKDRTSIWADGMPFTISRAEGVKLRDWLEGGATRPSLTVKTVEVEPEPEPAAQPAAAKPAPRMPKPTTEKSKKADAMPDAVKIVDVETREVARKSGATTTVYLIKTSDGEERATLAEDVAERARAICEEEAPVWLDLQEARNGKLRVVGIHRIEGSTP